MSEQEQDPQGEQLREQVERLRVERDDLKRQITAQRKAQQEKKEADSKEWFQIRS